MKKRLHYYLNDYAPGRNKLRIERIRGGNRTVWRAFTTYEVLESAKAFIEKVWKR